MANKQGTNQIVDAFIGDKLIEARYIGQTKYFDAYTEVTGTLPLSFNARVAGALKNYRLYGDSDGSGVQTENIGLLTANNLKFVNGSFTTIEYTKTGINIFISGAASNFCVYSLQNITPDMIGESFAVSWTGDDTRYCEIGLWDYEITTGNKFVEIIPHERVITITNDMVGKDIAVRFYFNNVGTYVISNFMLTEGSTAPTNYIPYGYKIPISNTSGVTENLFDPDNAEFVYGYFGAGSPISDSNSNTRTSFISCEPNTTYTVCKTLSARFSVAWSESKPANGVAIYGNVYENDATNITITTGATAQYLVFYYFHALYDTLTEQEIRDSIMVIKGSTAPDHYIPHRYTSNYDLMIGSTKLGAEEYVDYGEQKVYKRTAQLFNKNAKDVNNGYIDGYNIGSNGSTGVSVVSAVSEYIAVNPNSYYLITGNGTQYLSGSSVCFYNSNKNFLSGVSYNYTNPVIAESPAAAAYLRFTIRKEYVGTIVLVESQTAPSAYPPYLQPTDPPVPLSPIPTYKGENTLSSTETVGNVTIKGRISEIT